MHPIPIGLSAWCSFRMAGQIISDRLPGDPRPDVDPFARNHVRGIIECAQRHDRETPFRLDDRNRRTAGSAEVLPEEARLGKSVSMHEIAARRPAKMPGIGDEIAGAGGTASTLASQAMTMTREP